MIFASFTFLCYFLPIVLACYYLLPNSQRNLFLLIASFVFYGWGYPYHLTILLFLILTGFIATLLMEKYPAAAKQICAGASFYILGIFIFFKYTDFAIDSYNFLLDKKQPAMGILLPLGISFYVFQLISYIVDVYRKKALPQKSFTTLALYVSSFPQLIAGPIVRYDTVARQLRHRRHSLMKVYEGLRRFLVGLSKKVIIADMLGQSADKIFDSPIEGLTPGIAWLGAVLYALQIYFDFSGYSDMAIGLGRMFGFRFLENFNYPYISKSVSEFWRRWHISLSTWFKEYVYIPLGGNRKGFARTCFNLFFVFLLTGFWHGASWSFALWGIWYGVFIVLEKTVIKLYGNQCNNFGVKMLSNTLGRAYTMMIVLIGWVFFRSESLEKAWQYLKLMVNCLPFKQNYGLSYYIQGWGWFILGFALVLMTGVFKNVLTIKGFWIHLIMDMFLLGCLMLVVVLLTASGYNPFIYFRF